MAPPANMKTHKRGKRSTETNPSVSSVGSGTTSRYNLRSQGPPSYVRFAGQECPICLEEYSFVNCVPIIVTCGHSFCSQCITRCMASEGFTTCPICKKDLVHGLFISSKDFTKRIQQRTPRESLAVSVEQSKMEVQDGNVSRRTKKQMLTGNRRTVSQI